MSSDTPAVSILLPCFNSAAFVSKAILSVQAQTRPDWELVIVDNASTDTTPEICAQAASEDPRISFHQNQANIGPVRNWLKCAELARGPLASLLFSDDWYEPTFIAELAPQITDKVAFAYSSVTIHDNRTGGPQPASFRLPSAGLHSREVFLQAHFAFAMYGCPTSPGCAIFRRSDVLTTLSRDWSRPAHLKYLEHGAGPDLRLFLDALIPRPQFFHSTSPLANFTSHSSNLSWRPEVRAAYEAAKLHWAQLPSEASVDLPLATAKAWLTLKKQRCPKALLPRMHLSAWLSLPRAAFMKRRRDRTLRAVQA